MGAGVVSLDKANVGGGPATSGGTMTFGGPTIYGKYGSGTAAGGATGGISPVMLLVLGSIVAVAIGLALRGRK
jgi:hypothetical protein